LHEGAEWFIDFYAKVPDTGQLKRKRIKVNRVKGIAARRQYARALMEEIGRKLRAGWTPWAPSEPDQLFVTIGEALDQFERSKVRQLRHSSPYSYSSLTHVFREWCRDQGLVQKGVVVFDKARASAFMTYLGDERQVGNTTYNNYLGHMRMIWNYFRERCFTTGDPWRTIAKRKEPKKTRTYLTEQERRQLVLWVNEHMPEMLLPILLVYGCLIRPGEIKRMQVSMVDLDRQVITLPAEITKSGHERMPAIPNWMLPY